MKSDVVIISRVLDDISRKDYNFLPVINGEQLNLLDIINYFKTGNINHNLTENVYKYTNPLNGYYLKDFLYKKNILSKVINIFDYELDYLKEIIINDKPLAIALSTTFIVSLNSIKRAVDYIRSIDKNITIIVGGPYIINLCAISDLKKDQYNLKNLLTENNVFDIDYIVKEPAGENTLYKIIYNLKNNLPIDNIQNIASKKNNYIFNSFELENNDFENYSLQWDILNNNEITKNMPIQTSIGCKDKCKFCTYWKLSGKIIKQKSLETLKKEFRSLSKFKHVKSVRFVDDDFTLPISRLQDICKIMIEEKLNWKWSCWARVTSLTEESVKLMKESGCNNVLMGIESGNDKILKLMNKSHTLNDIIKAIELLNKYDILSFGYFICGYPGETHETVKDTINLINNSGLDSYEVFRFIPIPLITAYEERAENGLEGFGNKWKHNTMNSDEAIENIHSIIYNVTNSAYMPGGLEPVRYFLNSNFSRNEIINLVKNINSLWKLEQPKNNNFELDYQENIKKIKNILDVKNWD